MMYSNVNTVTPFVMLTYALMGYFIILAYMLLVYFVMKLRK